MRVSGLRSAAAAAFDGASAAISSVPRRAAVAHAYYPSISSSGPLSPLHFHLQKRNLQTLSRRLKQTVNSYHHQRQRTANMSTQPAHPALMIPGPIEFDDAVLQSMSHYRYDGYR